MVNYLKWLGHSAWQLTTSGGKTVFIDPWIKTNPLAPVGVEELPPAEIVLLTHDHPDHAGDAVAVVKQTGATLVAQPETIARYSKEGAEKVLSINVGGSVDIEGVIVTMIDAYHTSQTGTPAGYILSLEDGKVLYHAGDTAIHANMGIWAELFSIDVALLPIGGRYTMDGRQAAHALNLLRPKIALPMHYRTFSALAANADEFMREARERATSTEIRVLEPGGLTSF